MKPKNVLQVGSKFGCLTLIKSLGMKDFSTDERRVWQVKCDCGYEYEKVDRYITRKMNLYCSDKCGLREKK